MMITDSSDDASSLAWTYCTVNGLTSADDVRHNGQECFVFKPDPDNEGRWCVLFNNNRNAFVSIKSENLTRSVHVAMRPATTMVERADGSLEEVPIGKGLFATKAFKQGEIIFQERPMFTGEVDEDGAFAMPAVRGDEALCQCHMKDLCGAITRMYSAPCKEVLETLTTDGPTIRPQKFEVPMWWRRLASNGYVTKPTDNDQYAEFCMSPLIGRLNHGCNGRAVGGANVWLYSPSTRTYVGNVDDEIDRAIDRLYDDDYSDDYDDDDSNNGSSDAGPTGAALYADEAGQAEPFSPSDVVTITAARDIAAGEQLLIDYLTEFDAIVPTGVTTAAARREWLFRHYGIKTCEEGARGGGGGRCFVCSPKSDEVLARYATAVNKVSCTATQLGYSGVRNTHASLQRIAASQIGDVDAALAKVLARCNQIGQKYAPGYSVDQHPYLRYRLGRAGPAEGLGAYDGVFWAVVSREPSRIGVALLDVEAAHALWVKTQKAMCPPCSSADASAAEHPMLKDERIRRDKGMRACQRAAAKEGRAAAKRSRSMD